MAQYIHPQLVYKPGALSKLAIYNVKSVTVGHDDLCVTLTLFLQQYNVMCTVLRMRGRRRAARSDVTKPVE